METIILIISCINLLASVFSISLLMIVKNEEIEKGIYNLEDKFEEKLNKNKKVEAALLDLDEDSTTTL